MVAASACDVADSGRGAGPAAGRWRAWLESPGGELPFEIVVERREGSLAATILNGDERIAVPDVRHEAGELVLAFPHYDSRLRGAVSADGSRVDGEWTRTGLRGTVTRMRFHARAGDEERFPAAGNDAAWAAKESEDVSGRWAVDFASEEQGAVGVFSVAAGVATGTFLTATGDYRYLAGRWDGDRLRLSCFDGAHAFLFDARLGEDGSLRGDFWSRDSWHERWTATRDATAEIDDPFEATAWTGDVPLAELRFPDLDGELRSLDDPELAGSARIIELFGTWCPNCNDAAIDLRVLHRRYRDRGLSVLGLAFEMTGDTERDVAQVRRYAQHHGLEFPLLLAGTADKGEASAAFPALDRVRAYPTLIFLDRRNRVRAVYSGYSGPATGAAHEHQLERFESLIERLLEET